VNSLRDGANMRQPGFSNNALAVIREWTGYGLRVNS